jgi:hypothetical protein
VQAIRVYDNAHGPHDLHRYTFGGGKQPAETFFYGEPEAAMDFAIEQIRTGYEQMIRSWQKR